jgi:heme exporter protein B
MAARLLTSIRLAGLVAKKDLIEELRTGYTMLTLLLFVIAAVAMTSFIIGPALIPAELHSALLWIIIFFASQFIFNRSFVKEEEQGTASVLKLSTAPVNVYLGKLFSNLILLGGLVLLTLFCYYFFVAPPGGGFLLITAISITASICLAGASTILSALAAKADAGNALFVALVFPVILPILFTASKMTEAVFRGALFQEVMSGLLFLISIAVVLITLSILLFDFVWQD